MIFLYFVLCTFSADICCSCLSTSLLFHLFCHCRFYIVLTFTCFFFSVILGDFLHRLSHLRMSLLSFQQNTALFHVTLVNAMLIRQVRNPRRTQSLATKTNVAIHLFKIDQLSMHMSSSQEGQHSIAAHCYLRFELLSPLDHYSFHVMNEPKSVLALRVQNHIDSHTIPFTCFLHTLSIGSHARPWHSTMRVADTRGS